jgi:hypothetical protein
MKFQTCLKTSLPNLTLQNCLGECSALGGVTSFTEQGLSVYIHINDLNSIMFLKCWDDLLPIIIVTGLA